jgi:hypothetical protein
VPAFQAAAESGDLLYYPYDSHWSARGHRVAAQAVADVLRNIPCL